MSQETETLRELEEIQAALEARGGIHVLAVQKNKMPYPKGKNTGKDMNAMLGRADRPGDPELCWKEVVHQGALPAIVPGASNLVCVDIDKGDAKTLWKKYPPLFWVKTKSFGEGKKAGLHFFYDHPQTGEIGNRKWVLEGCEGDIRGDRGYCVIWDRVDFLKKLKGVNGKHRPMEPIFMETREKSVAKGQGTPLINPGRGVENVQNASEGNRNNTLNTEVFLAAKNGKLTPELEASFRAAARAQGLGESEIDATIESARRAGEREHVPSFSNLRRGRQEAGQTRQQTPAATPPREGEEKQARQPLSGNMRYPKDADGLREILRLMEVELRFDDRASAIYFKFATNFGDEDIPVGKWTRRTDNIDAKLRYAITQSFDNRTGGRWQISVAKWDDCIMALAPIVDPVKLWLESLPGWDGKPRLNTLIEDCGMKVRETEDENWPELLAWASGAVPMTAAYRTLNPGAEVDELVVLIGEQDWGKSTFAKLLVPHIRFHGDQLSFSASPKEQVEATLGKLIIEISEMAGSKRADTTEIKRFITRTHDEIRLAYAKSPSERPRRFALIGTSNENVLPNDPTGNRRFVAVELESGDAKKVRKYLGEAGVLEQIYAEVMVRLQKGETPRLPDHLKKTQKEINEDYRRSDPLEERVREVLKSMPPFFTSSRLAERIGLIEKGENLAINTGRRVNQCLRALGFRESRTLVCRDRVKRRLYDNSRHSELEMVYDEDLYMQPKGLGPGLDREDTEPI